MLTVSQRGEELAFFDVHGAAGLGGGFEQVGLAAEERGDLQQIDVFGGDVRLLGGVDVGGDGDAEFLGDFAEDAAAFLDAGAAEGVDGGAVGLVEGGFENEMDAGAVGDFLERAGHFPGEGLGFQRAGAEDEKRNGPADGDIADVEGIEGFMEWEKVAQMIGGSKRGLIERAEIVERGGEQLRLGSCEISAGFGSEHFERIDHGLGGAEVDCFSPLWGLGIWPRKSPAFWAWRMMNSLNRGSASALRACRESPGSGGIYKREDGNRGRRRGEARHEHRLSYVPRLVFCLAGLNRTASLAGHWHAFHAGRHSKTNSFNS